MPLYTKYYFWLIVTSLLCLTLEQIFPWRKQQKLLRNGICQDFFWLVFNGHFLGIILAFVAGKLIHVLNATLYKAGLPVPESLRLMSGTPVWLQFIVFFVLKDFIEWCIHRMLHRYSWLWEFHKLHHSIKELDWIGNFRFHWGEIIVYKTILYLPLMVLGANNMVILSIAVIGTLMQDLNHSNLAISWGPFRYIINSPKMHVWHHDVELHGKTGQNFGIVLSAWDWIFGTVYWPCNVEQPEKYGFQNMESYPETLPGRFVYPFYYRKYA